MMKVILMTVSLISVLHCVEKTGKKLSHIHNTEETRVATGA